MTDLGLMLDAVRNEQKVADQHVHQIACLIANRLRAAGQPGSWSSAARALADIKRELRDFDCRKMQWRPRT